VGEALGLSEDEVAFYDALAANDSAVPVLGDATLQTLARARVAAVHQNVAVDGTVRERVGAVAGAGGAAAAAIRVSAGLAGAGDAADAGAGSGAG